jgi:hypothetical protein
VLGVFEAAFEDNQAPAAGGFEDAALSIVLRFPQVDGLIPRVRGDDHADRAPDDQEKDQKPSATRCTSLALCHILATVKEAFAVARSGASCQWRRRLG